MTLANTVFQALFAIGRGMFGASPRIEDRRMTARTHLGLRLAGLLVLVALALVPRTRHGHHDPAIVGRAAGARMMETVSARPTGTLSDAKPRPRTVTHTPTVPLDVLVDVDESRLTN
jgi:hypothetical protein